MAKRKDEAADRIRRNLERIRKSRHYPVTLDNRIWLDERVTETELVVHDADRTYTATLKKLEKFDEGQEFEVTGLPPDMKVDVLELGGVTGADAPTTSPGEIAAFTFSTKPPFSSDQVHLELVMTCKNGRFTLEDFARAHLEASLKDNGWFVACV